MGKTPKFCPAVPCAIELPQVAGAGEPDGMMGLGVLLWVKQEVRERDLEGVGEGVLEQVGASAALPAGQAEGHPHAVHAALEVAPSAVLNVPALHCVHAALPAGAYVPAPHCVGAAEFAGQKEPAGHAVVVMVYDMPFPKMLGSLWKHSPICAP